MSLEGDEADALTRRDLHLMRRSGGHEEIIARFHGHGVAAFDRDAALFPRRGYLGIHRRPTGDKAGLAFLHEQIVIPVGMDFGLAVLIADGVDDLIAVMFG